MGNCFKKRYSGMDYHLNFSTKHVTYDVHRLGIAHSRLTKYDVYNADLKLPKEIGVIEDTKIQYPVPLDTFDDLWKKSNVSSYGHHENEARTVDPEIRNSREFNGITLNEQWEKLLLEQMLPVYIYKLQLIKVILYDENGYFGEHTDQIRHIDMSYTVVVNIPVESGSEYTFAVYKKNYIMDGNKLNVIAFNPNLTHSLKMLSGKRMCLVFSGLKTPDYLISTIRGHEKYGSEYAEKRYGLGRCD